MTLCKVFQEKKKKKGGVWKREERENKRGKRRNCKKNRQQRIKNRCMVGEDGKIKKIILLFFSKYSEKLFRMRSMEHFSPLVSMRTKLSLLIL